MKTSVQVSTPAKFTVHFCPYMDRGTQKSMRRVMAQYQDVDMNNAQAKFKAIAEEKSDKKRMDLLRKVSGNEQEAIFALQEVMVRGLVEKIVKDEDGSELPHSDFEWFFNRMKAEDFAELSLCVSAIVEETTAAEKKTK